MISMVEHVSERRKHERWHSVHQNFKTAATDSSHHPLKHLERRTGASKGFAVRTERCIIGLGLTFLLEHKMKHGTPMEPVREFIPCSTSDLEEEFKAPSTHRSMLLADSGRMIQANCKTDKKSENRDSYRCK